MIYLLITIYLLTLIYVFDYRKRNNGKSVWFTITCIVLICLSGLRYRVGGDTVGYMSMYDEFPTLFTVEWHIFSTQYQPLWNLYVLTCKTISSDFAFLQFTHAIILNVSLFVFIRKRIRNVFTFIFFYFILFYTLLNFEVLRESLAVAVSLMGFKYWEKKKWLPYYVFALIAYGFHVSAVILFILPFFRYIQLKL
ncbi:MAG: EpsG family protein, partial [Dysgonamonadaceae bacterium]|nr:EpsG family protein [Dysgonamonadaceae bacterium]